MTKLTLIGFITLLTTNLVVHANENRDLEHSLRDVAGSITQAPQKEVSIINKFKKMFEQGKVSGNIRSIYSSFDNKLSADTYATAVGVGLKYELASLNGFNAGIAFRTTYDVDPISGKHEKKNEDLSGTKGHSTRLSEAYINYKYKEFNLRFGRQIIDTPLADSDDIRMIPNSFEGYVAHYEMERFSLMAGHLNRWQGYDAGIDNAWVRMGKNGVNFVGLSYSDKVFDASLWYYNISNALQEDILNGADENGNNSFYADLSGHFNVNENIFLHFSGQYLKQNELDGSGVEANIYGAMAQVVAGSVNFSLAYNLATKEKEKHSFSGFGGGALYTNMDTMIFDEITQDRRTRAFVAALGYTIDDINFLYAYGNFLGDEDSFGAKEHIVAHNIGVEYTTKDELTLSAVYAKHENKEDPTSTFYTDNYLRILASYNF